MPQKKMTKAIAKANVTNRRKKAKEKAQDPQQASPLDDPMEPADEGVKLPDQPAEPSEPDGSSEDEDVEDPSKLKSLKLTPDKEQELAKF